MMAKGLEFSDDLVKWTPVGDALAATQNPMTRTDDGTFTAEPPTAADRRFFRVLDFPHDMRFLYP